MVTVRVRYSESDSPTTSKPGPILAEVAGTRMVNDLVAMAFAGYSGGVHVAQEKNETRI